MRAGVCWGLCAALGVFACGDDDEAIDSGTADDASVDAQNDAEVDAGGDVGDEDSGTPSSLVDTVEGPVEGSFGLGVHRFVGIPFAADAGGDNRWRAPQPVAAWTDTHDATDAGPICVQTNPFLGGSATMGQEDCLNLNVWTPGLDDEARPVLVWIHGGAFVLGSASDPAYDGGKLAAAGDVVVVSMNYRLGALGFFGHSELVEDETRMTNFGLLDQRAAMEWVQRNVARFGGDPDNVTIFGQSAGGYSVCAHVVSPGSAGLFHRAISESGVCAVPPIPLDQAEADADALAAAVACTGDEVIACLRTKSPDELSAAAPTASEPGGLFYQSGTVVNRPIGDDVVLPSEPLTVIAEGDASVVPFLTGSTTDEGTIFHGGFLGVEVMTEDEYLQALTRTYDDLAADIAAQYPVADYDSANDALIQVTTDSLFVCAARRWARAMSAAGAPTFLYTFDQAPRGGIFADAGVFHAAEVVFVFGNRSLQFGDVGAHQALSDAMMGYWTRFASTGDPNGSDATEWPPYQAEGDDHLTLATTIATGSGHRREVCDFWDDVFAAQ